MSKMNREKRQVRSDVPPPPAPNVQMSTRAQRSRKRKQLNPMPRREPREKVTKLEEQSRWGDHVDDDDYAGDDCEANPSTVDMSVPLDFVKIEAQYESQRKVRFVVDAPTKNFCKTLLHGRPIRTLAKSFMKLPGAAEAVQELVAKDLDREIKKLCQKKAPSISRDAIPLHVDNLTLKLTQITCEWKKRAPLLLKVLKAISGSSEDDTPSLVLAGSALLYERNSEMNLVQQALGLILDQDGAKDETIRLFNKLKVCVSASTVSRKKQQLQMMMDSLLDTSVSESKQSEDEDASPARDNQDVKDQNIEDSDGEQELLPHWRHQVAGTSSRAVHLLALCALLWSLDLRPVLKRILMRREAQWLSPISSTEDFALDISSLKRIVITLFQPLGCHVSDFFMK